MAPSSSKDTVEPAPSPRAGGRDGGGRSISTAAWIAAYCIASSSMTILNKAAVQALPFAYWLCLMQNTATLGFMLLIWLIVPRDHAIFGFRVPASLRVLAHWTPAAALFCLMLVSSLSALSRVSVPTVLVFRSLTPLTTALLEWRLLGERRPPSRAHSTHEHSTHVARHPGL